MITVKKPLPLLHPIRLLLLIVLIGLIQPVLARPLYAQVTTGCVIFLSDIAIAQDKTLDQYKVTFSIANDYTCVKRLGLTVTGEDNVLVFEQLYESDGRDSFSLRFDGGGLKPGKYRVQITPINHDGNQFVVIDQNNNEATIVTGQAEFFRSPKQREPIELEVQSVTPFRNEDGSGKLVVNFSVTQEDRLYEYDLWIKDQEANSVVLPSERKFYTPSPIEVALSAGNEILNASPEVELKKYELNLCVRTKDDTEEPACQPIPFIGVRAPVVSWWQKFLRAITTNQSLLGSILLIVLAVVGFIVIRNAQGKQETPLPPPPFIEGTGRVRANPRQEEVARPPTRPSRIRVQVLRTPKETDGKSRILARFPCTIGRDGCDLNIDDSFISRPHLEISSRNGVFSLTDLDSRNGTVVHDQKLQPNKPLKLASPTIVRLGPHTEVEIEPIV